MPKADAPGCGQFARQAAVIVVEVVSIDGTALQMTLPKLWIEHFAPMQYPVIVDDQQIPGL